MGKPIQSKAVHYGRNFDIGNWRDDRHVRCSRCGWICNLDRDRHSTDGSREGWGVAYDSTANSYTIGHIVYDDRGFPVFDDQGNYVYDDAVVDTFVDPVVVAGCPQCGTLLYDR